MAKFQNFSAKSASIIGKNAKKEFSVFGECIRMVRRIFDAYSIDPDSLDPETAAAVADCITAGVNPSTDLNIKFIVDHLTGTQWVNESGQIVERVKGELVPVAKWTPNKVTDYIYHKAKEIRFIRGRLHFNDSKQGAPFPSMVVIF